MKDKFVRIESKEEFNDQVKVYKSKNNAALKALASIYKAIVVDKKHIFGYATFSEFSRAEIPAENYNNVLDQAKCAYYTLLLLGSRYLSICSRNFIRALMRLESDTDKKEVIDGLKEHFNLPQLGQKQLTEKNASEMIEKLFPQQSQKEVVNTNKPQKPSDNECETDADCSVGEHAKKKIPPKSKIKHLPPARIDVSKPNKRVERKLNRMQLIRDELETYNGEQSLVVYLNRVMRNNLLRYEKKKLLISFNKQIEKVNKKKKVKTSRKTKNVTTRRKLA